MSPAPRPRFSDDDRRLMHLALRLAERGRGTTRPNPVVGAVLVKDGRIIGRGNHERAGGPHAEITALAAVGFGAPGATLYVTLEPCCHTGRTGPCTEPIIAAGVSRVVVGCRDSFPLVAGGGIARLRRAGVRVDVGCLEQECLAANRAFFHWVAHGRPHVTLKVASTLDGFIAPPAGRSRGVRWITGPPARRAAHELRARHDAILVGAATIRADDPRLDVRLPGRKRSLVQPLRVVLDGRLSTPPGARLFRVAGAAPPLLLGGSPPGKMASAAGAGFDRRRRALERAGGEVVLLPADRAGQIPIARVLRLLAQRGVQSLLVEGGSRVHGSFIAARLVDQVALFLAPQLQGAGLAISAGGGLAWSAPLRLGALRVRQVGGDILVAADVVSPRGRGK